MPAAILAIVCLAMAQTMNAALADQVAPSVMAHDVAMAQDVANRVSGALAWHLAGNLLWLFGLLLAASLIAKAVLMLRARRGKAGPDRPA